MHYYFSHSLNLKIKYQTDCSVCCPTGMIRLDKGTQQELQQKYFYGKSAIVWEAPAAHKCSSACVLCTLARNLPSSRCFSWNFDKSTIFIFENVLQK